MINYSVLVSYESKGDFTSFFTKFIKDLISQGLIPRSSAAQQTNDERSESRADTPQLCCGEFHNICSRSLSTRIACFASGKHKVLLKYVTGV